MLYGWLSACSFTKPDDDPSPDGYNLNKGKKEFLINRLEEVSGIAFMPGNDTFMRAVNDEEGRVYSIDLRNTKGVYDPFKFGKSGDYEDIAAYRDHWFVLQSNGNIHYWQKEERDAVTKQKLLLNGEYEGMCATASGLYVICKECKADPDTLASIFKLELSADTLRIVDTFALNTANITPAYRKHFSASAIARHPINGKWYILSHLSKMLVVADEHFNVLESVPLSGYKFIQPEGIAFNSKGDLYISNEGDETPGNIQIFQYNADTMKK